MTNPDDIRPSPDALLEHAQRESRGKLKIFIGAAPGVGKTYAMLRAAQARKKDGADVAVGIVETHQRSETLALMKGLDVVPRLSIAYRGIPFEEMDLDAVLRRKPALALVDELAHSNIPGARHPKRYQDVEELLDAGVDVYSTLNVQHIESLNDIVARITGITVRETVPDSIVQKADSIELIDLTPEELLQRLKEGKVYIPEQARLAMNRFFTPGNLTALRELALRQAADRVDADMESYMRRHAIAGPWPTSDRILVCISDDGQASALIRTAKRSAERRQAEWIALYVETHRHASLSETIQRDIAQALHLAHDLGGETMTVTGEDVPGEILRIARERNVSKIIVGKCRRSLGSRLVRPSVAAAVLDRGASFDILVMSGSDARSGHPPRTDTAIRARDADHVAWSWSALAHMGFAAACASLIAWGIAGFASPSALSLIYLIAVILVAVDRGFWTSAGTALLGFAGLDLLFIEPRSSLAIARFEDFIALAFFLVAAFAAGMIGDRLRRQVEVTRANALRAQALYDFTKTVAAAATLDDITLAAVRHVALSLSARTVLLLPRRERLEIGAAFPEETRLDTASNAAMDWAWRHGRPAGMNSDTLPGAGFYGVPLRAGKDTVGVLAVRPETGQLTPDQEHFLDSLASQSAVAFERAKLVGDIEEARVQTETERLRASLLSSVSHDLRTPLVAILGATTSLRDYWEKFDDAARKDLFSTIEEEADRLNRFVQNLLDMTQLVAGGLSLKRAPVDPQDLIGAALSMLRKSIGQRPLRLEVPDDVPALDGDFAILERVLVNIIDNACKYAPPDQPITITARRTENAVRITVTDRGPGIPENERERVFDMFYRVKTGATAPASGAGLGLAICRGFIEAHGGSITAQPGPEGVGTQIVLRLPVAPET